VRRVRSPQGIDGPNLFFYDVALVGTDPEAAPTVFGLVPHDAPASWSSGGVNADAPGWERVGTLAWGRHGRVYVQLRRADIVTPSTFGCKFGLYRWRLWGTMTSRAPEERR